MNGPIKWHGGKHYLAPKIVAVMPSRCKNPNKPDPTDPGWLHYVEPYFGGGSVLFANNPEGISEVVNDLNGDLTNFWNALKDPDLFSQFQRATQALPFSEQEFLWKSNYAGRVSAVTFFVRCRMSLAGRMKAFTGITRTRTRRGMNAEVSAWLTAVEGLPEVHARLKRVLILGPRSALDVIRSEDGPRTLFYLDPPYLHETRATTGEYEHEMTERDHKELLNVLQQCRGYVLLSGYRSDLYDTWLSGWRRLDFELPNNAAGGKEKRRMTESLWMNY